MGKFEVTQREYWSLMGTNPSAFTEDLDCPVERVSWHDATNYCAKLTQQEKEAGRLPSGYEYQLPNEAQWEYACRAGMTTATAFGNGLSSTQANFNGQSPYFIAAVGPSMGRPLKGESYAPNAWGLYDMHGNVYEWCLDWYGTYPGGSVTDPNGPGSGTHRVIRGGNYNSSGSFCRSASRTYDDPERSILYYGFRLALVPVR